MNDKHTIQMHILKELLFHPNARFTNLNIVGLSSDHFSYHIRELVLQNYVEKSKYGYQLTAKGKEYANQMDTDSLVLEKQPKVSVLICPIKVVNGTTCYAIQQRLKEPYYGFSGFMTGKMHFGEMVVEAAARELREEMGLEAKFERKYLLHEMVYDKTGTILEDKFFHALVANNVRGELISSFPGGANRWVTKDEFFKIEPVYHNEHDIFTWFERDDNDFKEFKYFIEKF